LVGREPPLELIVLNFGYDVATPWDLECIIDFVVDCRNVIGLSKLNFATLVAIARFYLVRNEKELEFLSR
jgi:hypothetical protein